MRKRFCHRAHFSWFTPKLFCALFEKDENDNAEKILREMIARGLQEV